MSSESGDEDHGTGQDDLNPARVGPHDALSPGAEAPQDLYSELAAVDANDYDQDDNVETFSRGYNKQLESEAEVGEVAEALTLPPRPSLDSNESVESSASGPDDTPSIQGSVLSSPRASLGASVTSSRLSPSPSPQPFDRRFQARLPSSSPLRAASPGFLTQHSRQSSVTSQVTLRSQGDLEEQSDEKQHPWEVVRWTKLKKISSQTFSEAGRRAFGNPTYLTIAPSIAVGTSRGIILLFDYQQTLKSIIGQGTAAAECGSVTSLAISADHSTVAAGHASGAVFTWEIARPAKPFLHIPPIDRSSAEGRKIDGHVINSAILHVGFLGMRHTALVSADDSGMAFSHLASRGLGIVGRSVNTTRVLGRYPEAVKTSISSRKPSSVLAFAALPLGNVEHSTDNLGLTALLTPYLLVIVSTTPIAQTQFKSPRAKDIAAHSAMTGSLAWFPAVKLKDSSTSQSKTKLAFCWSNVLSILEIDEQGDAEQVSQGTDPSLTFTVRNRWKCEEAILTLQWLSRSVLALLTISQRLIILEDSVMRIADSSDLNAKHIYHQDLFSRQLQPLVDKTDEEDYSMHGVIPDAFHMSFKAYKGRLFLLGANDISMGTLSNWADRLVSLMENNDFLAAIQLATSYYIGDAEKLTVGLPEDDASRQALVRPKLLEMISASLRYIFSDEDMMSTEKDLRGNSEALATATFKACLSMNATQFLFDEVYEWYSQTSVPDIFLTTLEPYILDGQITAVPPGPLEDLMNWYGSLGMKDRLEEMLCSLQTDVMDIDQVASKCKQFHLYDALIYVWTQARGDYVTPLIDLMLLGTERSKTKEEIEAMENMDLERKLFPYMAFTLTGRDYPRGTEMITYDATRAKASVYGLLFSSRTIRWPRPVGRPVLVHPEQKTEPTYPYLRFFLQLDAYNFMSMLNEAFEDSFLNEGEDDFMNGSNSGADEQTLDMSINRGRIIDIMLEVLSNQDSESDVKVILDIFIARNVAKYPGVILLPDPVLRSILIELCQNKNPDLADECQLSAEYLLSVFQPIDLRELASLFREAGYFQVLKSIYRGGRQYAKWLETCFQDIRNKHEVFDCMQDCLVPTAGLNKRQLGEVKAVIRQNAPELANLDVAKLATILRDYASDLLNPVFQDLENDSQGQYFYLKALLHDAIMRPDDSVQPPEALRTAHNEDFIKLMCRFEPQEVAGIASMLKPGELHLDKVLPFMEDGGAVDAAVMLMANDGLVRDAMARLHRHLRMIGTALSGLIRGSVENPDAPITQETADQILEELRKYVRVGLWLCRSQAEKEQRPKSRNQQRRTPLNKISEKDLSIEETLWLDLIDVVVAISRDVTESGPPLTPMDVPSSEDFNAEAILDGLRIIVQETFTTLLASTAVASNTSFQRGAESAPTAAASAKLPDQRFLRILRLFLARAAQTAPSLSDLRGVLTDIFSAYAFEETMLALAHDFIDKDVFVQVAEADKKRRAGWRPRAQICERCKRRAWGTGSGRAIWDAWEAKSKEDEAKRTARLGINPKPESHAGAVGEDRKGKSKAIESTAPAADAQENDDVTGQSKPDSLVLFSCSHLFHKACLEQALAELPSAREGDLGEEQGRYKCPLC